MLTIAIVENKLGVREALKRRLTEELVVVIAPPERFQIPVYYLICPTPKIALRVQTWLESWGNKIHWENISKGQTMISGNFLVFSFEPHEGKNVFPKPEGWEIQ